MGSLVRYVQNTSQIGYGVNVWEQRAPAAVQGAATSIVGMIGAFPWGPPAEILEFGSAGEALDVLAPGVFEASRDTGTFPALLALLLPWPGALRIVRTRFTGAAAASRVFNAGGSPAITATALHVGTAGNEISVQVAAATGGSGTRRNLIVRIGSAYMATYEDLAAGDIAGVEDPYVGFTGSTLPDVAAAALLTGGDNGTAAAGNFTDSDALGLFEAEDADASVLFCAGVPSSLSADVNSGLESFVADLGRSVMAVLCTEAGLSATDVQTSAASYRSDRLVYTWPRVYLLDEYLETPTEVLADGGMFAACAMASVDPEISPGGAPGASALRKIVGLEVASPARATLDALKAAGVAVFFESTKLGPILRGGITTSLSGEAANIFRRRMTDFIADSIAAALEPYAEAKLDLLFVAGQPRPSLGETTGAEVAVVTAFLEGLKAAQRISDYSVDPYSGNTSESAAANRFYLTIRVRLFGAQMEIVLKHTIGAGVAP